MRPAHIPGIIGTRDSFGIGRHFIDDQSGKEITTWREWEKAGYKDIKDAMGYHKDAGMQNEMKRKYEKVTKYDKGKKFSITV